MSLVWRGRQTHRCSERDLTSTPPRTLTLLLTLTRTFNFALTVNPQPQPQPQPHPQPHPKPPPSPSTLTLTLTSPSQRLASVSIDNSVRVWGVSADAARQLVAVLQGHRSMVKGVSWDPIGRYLASQGDDRAVVVWEQRDWTEAARIEAPFQRSTAKTLFRRLAWSPDGQFLCCPHAFKKPVNIAVVLRRPSGQPGDDGWAQECDFVGHNSPVGVVAFNQLIFRRGGGGGAATGGGTGTAAVASGADDAPSAPYCCCAVGGQDCLLSIWLTSRPKPLVVVKDIFEQDVLDLAWTPDGRAPYSSACVVHHSLHHGLHRAAARAPHDFPHSHPTLALALPALVPSVAGTLSSRARWTAPSPR